MGTLADDDAHKQILKAEAGIKMSCDQISAFTQNCFPLHFCKEGTSIDYHIAEIMNAIQGRKERHQREFFK